jgi:hypothetical protein
MIYTALCIMFWMHVYPLLGEVGWVWALEFSSIFGLQMALAYRLDAISQGPKNLQRQGDARIQNIMHTLYKSQVHK